MWFLSQQLFVEDKAMMAGTAAQPIVSSRVWMATYGKDFERLCVKVKGYGVGKKRI